MPAAGYEEVAAGDEKAAAGEEAATGEEEAAAGDENVAAGDEEVVVRDEKADAGDKEVAVGEEAAADEEEPDADEPTPHPNDHRCYANEDKDTAFTLNLEANVQRFQEWHAEQTVHEISRDIAVYYSDSGWWNGTIIGSKVRDGTRYIDWDCSTRPPSNKVFRVRMDMRSCPPHWWQLSHRMGIVVNESTKKDREMEEAKAKEQDKAKGNEKRKAKRKALNQPSDEEEEENSDNHPWSTITYHPVYQADDEEATFKSLETWLHTNLPLKRVQQVIYTNLRSLPTVVFYNCHPCSRSKLERVSFYTSMRTGTYSMKTMPTAYSSLL